MRSASLRETRRTTLFLLRRLEAVELMISIFHAATSNSRERRRTSVLQLLRKHRGRPRQFSTRVTSDILRGCEYASISVLLPNTPNQDDVQKCALPPDGSGNSICDSGCIYNQWAASCIRSRATFSRVASGATWYVRDKKFILPQIPSAQRFRRLGAESLQS